MLITKAVAKARLNKILQDIHQKYGHNKNIKILDIGCGNKYYTKSLRGEGYYIIGIDKRRANEVPWIKEDPDMIMDATNMDFEDETFHVTIAIEVIEHADILNEMKRVTKRNGLIIITTPTPGTDWIRKILVKFNALQKQDIHGHEHLVHRNNIELEEKEQQLMFLGTSQYIKGTRK